ncbi:hypothetical protein M8C12_19085 [Bacillus amyloliquefaciens]
MPGERMYRTGDLVKWNAQSGIEYIGRIDQQVKVRGYRIELSEIEVRLAQLADVHDAAVTAVEDKAGNTALCAYVAPRQDDIEALKAALKDTQRVFQRGFERFNIVLPRRDIGAKRGIARFVFHRRHRCVMNIRKLGEADFDF